GGVNPLFRSPARGRAEDPRVTAPARSTRPLVGTPAGAAWNRCARSASRPEAWEKPPQMPLLSGSALEGTSGSATKVARDSVGVPPRSGGLLEGLLPPLVDLVEAGGDGVERGEQGGVELAGVGGDDLRGLRVTQRRPMRAAASQRLVHRDERDDARGQGDF